MMTSKPISSADTPFPKEKDSELGIDDYMTLVELDALINARPPTRLPQNPEDMEYGRALLMLQKRTQSGSETHRYIELLRAELKIT
jgi:hypothetical protein